MIDMRTFMVLLILLSLSLSAAGCAGTSEEDTLGTADGEATVDAVVDAGVADTVVPTDTASAVVDTAPPQDISVPDPCPGGPGCVCKENSDCDTALCIDTPEGRQCARTCVDQCPDGFKCAQATVPGGDVLSICVPRYGRLCDPCATSKDCTSLGLDGSACVDQGPEGAFCGLSCQADDDCPKGYGCQEVTST